jgi:hypothetical protein
LINAFIDDKCNWNKPKVQSTAKQYADWMGYEAIAYTELHQKDDEREAQGYDRQVQQAGTRGISEIFIVNSN